jgi:hypothetical protein
MITGLLKNMTNIQMLSIIKPTLQQITLLRDLPKMLLLNKNWPMTFGPFKNTINIQMLLTTKLMPHKDLLSNQQLSQNLLPRKR